MAGSTVLKGTTGNRFVRWLLAERAEEMKGPEDNHIPREEPILFLEVDVEDASAEFTACSR